MALLDWNPALSVAVTEMDDEHKRLIALVNELNEAMKAGAARPVLGRIFDELGEYTRTHFVSEEAFMESVGYPHLDAHRAEHAALCRQIEVIRENHAAGGSMISLKLMEFLRDWVSNHIQGSDHKYGVWAGHRVAG